MKAKDVKTAEDVKVFLLQELEETKSWFTSNNLVKQALAEERLAALENFVAKLEGTVSK